VVLLLLFTALEIFHAFASWNSVSYEVYKQIFVAGQYVTVAIFVIMIYAFDLKRRFTSSVTGKFYEQSIVDSPERITRLRDELDTYILKYFFKNQGPRGQANLFSNIKHEVENGGTP
jgi:hypothetical protein